MKGTRSMKILRTIHAEDLEDIAVGGAILGTGGGGDPYVGKLMAQQAIKKHGPVKLVDVDRASRRCAGRAGLHDGRTDGDDREAAAGRRVDERLPPARAILGRKIDAVLCGEAGGINSTTPFVVAAASGLPLVDGDGMGRAYPELQMVTFTMHGVSATPMVLCDDKGNSLVLDTVSNAWTERLARAATVEMGGSALLAFYSMSGETAKRAVVRGTLSLCARLGRTLRETRAAHGEPVAAIAALLDAKIIFHGRVKDIDRRTVGGFARGTARFDGVEEWKGHAFKLDFQNEFLMAERDGKVLVTTPDLITLLEAESGNPVTANSLRYGLRLVALAFPSNPQWLHARPASRWSGRAISATTSTTRRSPRSPCRLPCSAPPDSGLMRVEPQPPALDRLFPCARRRHPPRHGREAERGTGIGEGTGGAIRDGPALGDEAPRGVGIRRPGPLGQDRAGAHLSHAAVPNGPCRSEAS